MGVKRAKFRAIAVTRQNFLLILFAAFSFCIGTWVGFYCRIYANKSLGSLRISKGRRVQQTVRPPTFEKLPMPFEDERICVPRENVMFLKTHKTASSAVQNVLMRYTVKNNLTIGLSDRFDIRFHYGNMFKKEYVRKSNRPINMLMHHMVFNRSEVEKVLPKGSLYITILREPTALFESMFDYFHYDCPPFSRLKMTKNALEFWLDHADLYFKGKNDGHFSWFAKNGVFFDMGFDHTSDDDHYIQKAIKELDDTFDLVMISDYFAESMLLLREKLCWSMEDILYLKINARSAPSTILTENLKSKIREWNKADAAVFDHFNQTFWKKVENYGLERMKNDLKILEGMNADLQQKCIEGGPVSNDKIKDKSSKVYNPKGVKMEGYNIKDSARNDQTCVNLIKGEIQWTRELMAASKSHSAT